MKHLTPVIVAAFVVAAIPSTAHAAPRFTCEQVRWAVKTFGKPALEVMGKTYGVTKEELNFAKRCLAKGAGQS